MNNSIIKMTIFICSISITISQLSAAAPSKQSMAPKPGSINPLLFPPHTYDRMFACKMAHSNFDTCVPASQTIIPSPSERASYFSAALQHRMPGDERSLGCLAACPGLHCLETCLYTPVEAKPSLSTSCKLVCGKNTMLSPCVAQCIVGQLFKKDKKS